MIFVTLGSQKFQFNRLLIEIDRLVEEGKITEEVFAQTGYSNYKPKNYEYKNFLDRDEFSNRMDECNIVITHGGTGAIINAIKKDKRVIAIARLEKFNEHVDDHQLQIVDEFTKMGFITSVNNINELHREIVNIDFIELKKYISNTQRIVEKIQKFLEGE